MLGKAGIYAIAGARVFVEQCNRQQPRIPAVIDSDGFRPNVGIILTNGLGQVLWARRIGQEAWQFPQGGIQRNESPEQALFRELHEEVGLMPEDVEILACTRGWLRYRLPQRLKIGKHTSELQSRENLVCRLLLEKKN